MHGFVHPIIPHFCLAFEVFSFVLHTKLGLPHPLILKVTHCICGQPLDPTRTHLSLLIPQWGGLYSMILFKMYSPPSQEMWGFMFHVSKPMHFHHLFFSLLGNKLTSCYQLIAFTPCRHVCVTFWNIFQVCNFYFYFLI
jgi:hypothetical protein